MNLKSVLLVGAAVLGLVSAAVAEPFVELKIGKEGAAETDDTIVVIELRDDLAPKHVERITTLVGEGAYNDVVFHRVIEGFMAQTGDVENGKRDGDLRSVGTGGSAYDDLPAEFGDEAFDRGVVGMARSQDPNSANSQFFIMFEDGHFLNGQYTVIGVVSEGMEAVDAIKRGDPALNGAVTEAPDFIRSARIITE